MWHVCRPVYFVSGTTVVATSASRLTDIADASAPPNPSGSDRRLVRHTGEGNSAIAREALLRVNREAQSQLCLCAQHKLAFNSPTKPSLSAAEILSANSDLYQAVG